MNANPVSFILYNHTFNVMLSERNSFYPFGMNAH